MKIFKDSTVRRAMIIASALVALASIFTILGNLGAGIDRDIRAMRYAIGDKKPSGDIALIAMDERSIQEIGVYPWPRGTHGRLIESLQNKGVKRLGFDIAFVSDAPNQSDDVEFANAISESEFAVGLAVPGDDTGGNTSGEEAGNVVKGIWPNQRFINAGADTFSIWTDLNSDGQFEYAPHSNIVDGKPMIPMAKWLAGLPVSEGRYLVDWDLDQRDIPTFSYSDILTGKVNDEDLKDKILLVGADSSRLGDFLPIATGEYVAGARAQIIAAETISEGDQVIINSTFSAIGAILLAVILISFTKGMIRYFALLGIGGTFIVAQSLLESRSVAILPIGDTLLVLLFYMIAFIAVDVMRHFYGRITQNEATGLPNLLALKNAPREKTSIIAMHVSNNLDILSELGTEGRDKIMLKVALRIEMKNGGRQAYQVDSSCFVWRGTGNVESDIAQIEEIQKVLRSGIGYANATIDVFTNAGIESRTDIPVDRAAHNAGIAANRASDRGLAWEIYQENDSGEHWKVSVVSAINTAIAEGQLWVAYQPKVDSKTDEIIGAEALVRWKHPTRGDIRPDAFIPLLEKSNRTEELTRFMLDKAIEDFSGLSECNVAVNVSPLLLGRGKLYAMIEEALEGSDFNPARLTIEVTESERLSEKTSVSELKQISSLGVKISIDDYGMGNSTVNYLRILPAAEVKIDRSFISNVLSNKSDSMVVKSTIELAHQLGMRVVAEGVENAEIQDYLRSLDCDLIQGYHTGKPVPFDVFYDVFNLNAVCEKP